MPFDADTLLGVHRAAPELDPTMKAAIAANSGDLQSAMELAGGVAAFGGAAKMRSQLADQDPEIQLRLWNGAKDSTRSLLLGVGYRPPVNNPVAEQHAKRGWSVGRVLHDVTRPGVVAIEEVGSEAKDTVSKTLHAAGSPLRQVQHLYRAAALMTDENVMAGRGQMSLHGVMSPGTWGRTWGESKHGERTFSPVGLQKADELWGADTVALAKQLASGMKPDDIVLAAPENERAGLVRRIQGNADLQDATAYLNASHLSLGRRLTDPMLAITNPTLHRVMSGGVDAMADWYADPSVVGPKVLKDRQLAEYAIKDASDVTRLFANNPSVWRNAEDVVARLNEGGAAKLMADRPQWAQIAPELVKENVNSVEGLHDWLRGQAGRLAMSNGRLSGLHGEGEFMPYLSKPGEVGLWLKTATKGRIDWAADAAKLPGFRPLGQLGRRMVTMLPKGVTFNPEAPDAANKFMHIAREFLPEARAQELTNEWISIEKIGAKKDKYVALLDEMRANAGIDVENPWWKELKADFDNGAITQTYSMAKREGQLVDKMVINGEDARIGFLDGPKGGHFSTSWALPSYKDFLTATRKARATGLDRSKEAMGTFMSEYWRPSVLLRPAFALRAGGEEAVQAMIRHSPSAILKAKAAGIAGNVGPLTPGDPLHKVWSALTSHLPEELVARIETPQQLMSGVLFGNAQRATRAMAGKVAGPRLLAAAEDLSHDPNALDSFNRFVSAAETRGAGYLDNPDLERIVFGDGKVRQAYLSTSGRFRGYVNGDKLYDYNWHGNLTEVAQSRLGRKVLEHIDQPFEDQVAHVEALLRDPSMARVRDKALRNLRTSDDRIVGLTATQAEAHRDWAETVVDHVNSLVRNEEGTISMDGMANRILDGNIPSVAELGGLDARMKPFEVKGPELLEEHRNPLRGLIDAGFYHMVGKPMDWMIRQPMFLHNYALAQETTQSLRALGASEEMIRSAAIDKAVADTVPFIHDPRLRTQFDVQVRNLFPFLFAQEQFYKRIARSAAFNPAAFRQTQLVMEGFRHVGLVHKDANGDDYFFYPGAGVVQETLAHALKAFTGVDAVLPIPVGFSGQVKFVTPGLERLGLPSASPVIGVPLHALATRFPELADAEEAMLGERGAGRSYWEMVTPPTVSRFVQAFSASPETNAQMASATAQGIKYLESSGHGLPAGANSDDIEKWQERVTQWARSLLLTRAVMGFTAPATPQAQLDPKHLNEELRGLFSSGLPYEEAARVFIERHPDGTPYLVFPTRTSSGGSLPSTIKAAKYMADNYDLLSKYRSAGGWLVPQAPTDKSFSMVAYREQLALEMRTKKTPNEFWRDVKYAQAADPYFQARDAKDLKLEEVKGNRAATHQVNQIWTNWKAEFDASHPIFAEMLQDPQGHIRRARVLTELRQALLDPATPASPQTGHLDEMVQAYDNLNFHLLPLKDATTVRARDLKTSYKTIFSTWAQDYATRNPDVANFYTVVIRPEVKN